MTNTDQMELGLSTAQRLANSLNHRQRRLSRSRWWFAQMRRAVDTALDWQPAPPARPEQTWFDDRRLLGSIELPPARTHQVSG
jgi:hypothetical protein